MAHGGWRSTRRRRPEPRSLFDHRPQLWWTLRAGSHVILVLLGRVRGNPGRAGLLALAMAGDAAHRRWLEHDRRSRAATRAVVDTFESAVWTVLAGGDADAAYWVQQAHVVPPAMEWGYRVGAGDRAVPVVEPPRAYPPLGRELATTILELGATTLMPLAVHHGLATWRGSTRRPAEVQMIAFAAAGSLGLARHRARIQDEARRQWWERAEVEVAREVGRARASSAIRASPGHDFKKTLTTLGWNGSEACLAAAHRQAVRPHRRAVRADGTTIFGAALGIPVEPAERRSVWISDEQRRVLDAFVDEVDAELETADPPPRIDVLGVDGTTVRLSYRGRRIDLENPQPRLEAALDPVVPALVVGMVWKLISASPVGHRWHRGFLTASVLLDVLNAVSYERSRRSRAPRRFDVAVSIAVLSAAVAGVGIHRSRLPTHKPDGGELYVGSFPAYAVLGLVGTCWQQLDPRVRGAALVACVVQWTVLVLPGRERDRLRLVSEAVALWQAVAAPQGITSHVAAEAARLEDTLQDELQRRVRAARVRAADEERAEFRAQLELVEAELARLGDSLDPDLARHVEAQCEELRTWLDDPASREGMIS